MDFLSGNTSRPKWGDDEDDTLDFSQEITTETIPESDGSVRKTVVEYKTNDKGQRVKIVKKVRMYKKQVKINKNVEERKKWKKFGDCANAKGIESGVTSIGEEVYIDTTTSEGATEPAAGPRSKGDVVNLGIVCRNCGKTGDHWTLKCPYFKGGAPPAVAEERGAADRAAPLSSGGEGKYVPPGKSRGITGSGSSSAEADRPSRRGPPGDEAATIRVTNLSEDTKEADLNELFRSFGPISRIFLAKDKVTNLSKGFAFITFVYREDAAKAIEKLSGKFGYDHLILHLEWAKPATK